jgi:hypothetical protein
MIGPTLCVPATVTPGHYTGTYLISTLSFQPHVAEKVEVKYDMQLPGLEPATGHRLLDFH